MAIKCRWCDNEAYAYRSDRWSKDPVCRDCVGGYPHEGSFEPFVPWTPTANTVESANLQQPTTQG